MSSSDFRAAANCSPPQLAAARESSSSSRLLSSVCRVASSSARCSAASSACVGPVGICSTAGSTVVKLVKRGSTQATPTVATTSTAAMIQLRWRELLRIARSSATRSSSICGNTLGSISSSSRTELACMGISSAMSAGVRLSAGAPSTAASDSCSAPAAVPSRPSVSCNTALISSATWRMDGGRSRPCLASSHATSSSRRGGIGFTGLMRGTGSVAIFRASKAG